MKKKALSYTEAFNQLKQISLEIQQGNISMELLPEKIKLAKELLDYCQDTLRNVESSLNHHFSREESLLYEEE